MKAHIPVIVVLCSLGLLAGVGLILLKQELAGTTMVTASMAVLASLAWKAGKNKL